MARLKVKYTEEIAPALMKKFQYKSVMQIPQIAKVIVNVGCGESKNNAKEIEAICKDIATITGQKPITTKARKSVANFKVREGETVGVKVTLRGDKMWEFLDRLFNVRHQPQCFRRPRQLCHGPEGAAHLPRNRV